MKIEIALAQIFSEFERAEKLHPDWNHMAYWLAPATPNRNCHTLTLAFADWQVNKNDLFFWQ